MDDKNDTERTQTGWRDTTPLLVHLTDQQWKVLDRMMEGDSNLPTYQDAITALLAWAETHLD